MTKIIKGEIADVVELAATPAVITLCTDEIEKSGKAKFKVFGKTKSLSIGDPTETASNRPPTKSPSSAKTKTTSSSCSINKRAPDLKPAQITATNRFYQNSTTKKVCDFNRWPQPCAHFRSVIRGNPSDFETIACTDIAGKAPHPQVEL